jgi:hypothetical protein
MAVLDTRGSTSKTAKGMEKTEIAQILQALQGQLKAITETVGTLTAAFNTQAKNAPARAPRKK